MAVNITSTILANPLNCLEAPAAATRLPCGHGIPQSAKSGNGEENYALTAADNPAWGAAIQQQLSLPAAAALLTRDLTQLWSTPVAGDIVVYVIMVGTFCALVVGWWYSKKHGPKDPA
jgi:hypothetical protein